MVFLVLLLPISDKVTRGDMLLEEVKAKLCDILVGFFITCVAIDCKEFCDL